MEAHMAVKKRYGCEVPWDLWVVGLESRGLGRSVTQWYLRPDVDAWCRLNGISYELAGTKRGSTLRIIFTNQEHLAMWKLAWL